MKKLLSFMLIAMSVLMLSSCIIVATNDEPPTYSMTFCNDTKSHIYDWYLKDKDGKNYAKSDDYCEIERGDRSTKKGLKEKDYQIWFCLLATRETDVYAYTQNYTHLDDDQIFYLSDQSFHARSAAADENAEPEYVLITADGTVLELETVVIKK